MNPVPRPLVVVILDGWGISFLTEGNAIATAHTPTMDSFAHYYPTAALQAASMEVGLPWGEVGNSETGHRNIGAGRVEYQALPLIDQAIENGSFFENKVFFDAVEHVKKHNSRLHLMGLLSPGGVHSHMNHLFALLKLCSQQHLRDNVFLHLFTDGRDTPPQSVLPYITQLEDTMGKYGVGKIASVTGRFYAMDRNANWDRTAMTYNMLTGQMRPAGASNAQQAVNQSYAQNTFDEMILPTAITRGGDALAPIQDNDAVIYFNFRPDRARQLTEAFVQPEKVDFPTKTFSNLYFATLTQYDPNIPCPAAYIDEKADYPLARVISEAGLSQFHIAETEKYAHITYYLNVGHEETFPGEEHVLIPSSAVKSFATEPHMQAEQITDRVIHEIEQSLYDVYFINYANADMVGHTGDFKATVEACQFVDACLARLFAAAAKAGGGLVVTADHGNAEEKIHPSTGAIETDHTSNPVPFHLALPTLGRTTPKTDEEVGQIFSAPIGVLADVAPTILDILSVPKPDQMTGVSLLNSLQ
jgi:2,3-bisphosphoglycerate-independent phosphoglycerate mutase